MAPGRRTGRPRAGERTLSREGILRAALELVDTEGVAALSMRRLASALGVDPMALYHHLDGKDAVIAGLVELAFGGLPVPAGDAGDWRAQVRAIAGAYHGLAMSHPNLILHLVTSTGWAADAALDLNEALYAALEQAGMPPRLVLVAADLIVDYIHGYVLGAAGGAVGQPEARLALSEQLDAHGPQSYPALRRALAAFGPEERTGDLGAGLELIIAGIAAVALADG